MLALLPNWVGDAVMFTPTLRALRARWPEAELTLLGRPAPAAALRPNPWADQVLTSTDSIARDALRLRGRRYDLAVLGPNSLRSALCVFLGGCRRRVGYGRDGRGWLLTDRLQAPRDEGGGWAVTPALDYYLELARHLGCDVADRRMELGIDPADAARADELLAQAHADPHLPIVLLNPGASFGGSKLYPAPRFAAVADHLVDRRGAQIVITAGPGEGEIARAVAKAMNHAALLNLADVKNTIGLVKAMTARSRLMITNDTGPRHFAAALAVPVVTIFGATDPGWTTLDCPWERIVRVGVPCGPCRKKQCPLPPGDQHHQCMRNIPPEMVLAAAEELLG